jgi:hypothetical protein
MTAPTSLPLPYLHLGMPRTATALIQRQVFPRHSGLCFFGKCVPEDNMWMTRENARFIKQIPRYVEPEALEGLKRVGQKMLLQAGEQGRVPLWSEESWSSGSVKRRFRIAKNFQSALGPCKVILVLRQPHDFLESLYFQRLAAAQLGENKRFGQPGSYFTLEHWLDTNLDLPAHGDLSNLDYARTADIYASVFGADALGIYLYEDLKEDAAKYARGLAAFLGVDGDEMAAHLGNKHFHARIAEQQVERIRNIDASPLRRLLFRWRSPRDRRRILNLGERFARPDHWPRARAALSEQWTERIAELTAPGNRRLLERWGVALDRHEYPL